MTKVRIINPDGVTETVSWKENKTAVVEIKDVLAFQFYLATDPVGDKPGDQISNIQKLHLPTGTSKADAQVAIKTRAAEILALLPSNTEEEVAL
jgi:hypothetical protein